MWTIPYLVSVLCMQLIAINKKALLKAESDSKKRELERVVQDREDRIKSHKEALEKLEGDLSLEREALQGLLPSSPGKWLIIISSN